MSMFCMYRNFAVTMGIFVIIACTANIISYFLYYKGVRTIKKKAKELNVDGKQLEIVINEYTINTEHMFPVFSNRLIAVDIILCFIMFMGMISEL